MFKYFLNSFVELDNYIQNLLNAWVLIGVSVWYPILYKRKVLNNPNSLNDEVLGVLVNIDNEPNSAYSILHVDRKISSFNNFTFIPWGIQINDKSITRHFRLALLKFKFWCEVNKGDKNMRKLGSFSWPSGQFRSCPHFQQNNFNIRYDNIYIYFN